MDERKRKKKRKRGWEESIQKYKDIARGAETVEEVKKKLEQAGRDVDELTVFKISQELGIKEAKGKLWGKSRLKYIKEALEEGVKEPEEIKKALNKRGRDINIETAKHISKEMEKALKITERAEIEEATQNLKQGAEKKDLKEKETVDREIIEKSALNYAKRLNKSLDKGKIKGILEKKGFKKPEIKEIMEKI